MMMLESYHLFTTLRFHDSGDQESYVSFSIILLIYKGYYTAVRRYEFYLRVVKTNILRTSAASENYKYK